MMSIAYVQPVVIALLVVVEVAVWQVRVALATRGRKRIAAVLGAVNAVISVAALGQVVTHLDRPMNIAGYAVGVAVGVYIGVVVDGRYAGDPVEHRVAVPGDGTGLGEDLRARGWSVMMHATLGLHGPATVLSVVAESARTADVERDLEQLAPGAFRTSSRLRSAAGVPVPSRHASAAAGSAR
jgi:uncharacterized protein YebE (UPF0316 family)